MFEQAIRSAMKTSVASSWHFISTSFLLAHNQPIRQQPNL